MGLKENMQYNLPVSKDNVEEYGYDISNPFIKSVYGVWNYEDFYYTTDTSDFMIPGSSFLSFYNLVHTDLTYEQMNDRCKKRISKRLKEKGVMGTIKFEYKKLIQTWGDGTYYVPTKLSRYPIENDNSLAKFVRLNGIYFDKYNNFSHGVHVIMLSFIFISTLINIKSKKNYDFNESKYSNYKMNILRVAIFGLIILLELWETRSRYLVHYILVLLILCIPALDFLSIKLINFFKNISKKTKSVIYYIDC